MSAFTAPRSPLSPAAPWPATTSTAMTGLSPALNDKGQQLYRTAVRDACFRLLNSVDMPGDLAQEGRAWLQKSQRPIDALEKFKDRITEVLEERRTNR